MTTSEGMATGVVLALKKVANRVANRCNQNRGVPTGIICSASHQAFYEINTQQQTEKSYHYLEGSTACRAIQPAKSTKDLPTKKQVALKHLHLVHGLEKSSKHSTTNPQAMIAILVLFQASRARSACGKQHARIVQVKHPNHPLQPVFSKNAAAEALPVGAQVLAQPGALTQ